MPTTSGMRKLSSSPHLLGICEVIILNLSESFILNLIQESEDGSADQSTSTFFNATKNRSFGGGHSSLKSHSGGRNNRSAFIGFAQARNSQRSLDIGINVKSISRSSFSASFDYDKPSLSVQENNTSSEYVTCNGDSFTLSQMNTTSGLIFNLIFKHYKIGVSLV